MRTMPFPAPRGCAALVRLLPAGSLCWTPSACDRGRLLGCEGPAPLTPCLLLGCPHARPSRGEDPQGHNPAPIVGRLPGLSPCHLCVLAPTSEPGTLNVRMRQTSPERCGKSQAGPAGCPGSEGRALGRGGLSVTWFCLVGTSRWHPCGRSPVAFQASWLCGC